MYKIKVDLLTQYNMILCKYQHDVDIKYKNKNAES